MTPDPTRRRRRPAVPARRRVAILTATLLLGGLAAAPAAAQPRRAVFQAAGSAVVLEGLDDDLLHFEFSAGGAAPAADRPIATSLMVHRRDYPGARTWAATASGVETGELRVVVAPATLCLTVTDKVRRTVLTTVCPADIGRGDDAGITLAKGRARHVYGLGEQFITPGESDGSWVGRERTPGTTHGNLMVNFAGGQVGNAQFPVMYAVGPAGFSWALFLDRPEAQRWDFRADPWRVRTGGDRLRGYLMSGPGLPDLRADYVELTGRPPVPPRQAFGLWVSEFGFDHWHELETRLASLRADSVPVDGFVLDLQWFGGIVTGSEQSPMGSLTWDLKRFPDPAGRIRQLRERDGVGIIPIEEPFISRGILEHDTLAARGFLVRQRAGGPPAYLSYNPWWGKGGMVDFTSEAAGAFWHDWRRRALVAAGVAGHWTDLGEPEQFDSTAWYHGVEPGRHDHRAAHNLYNLAWSRSVFEGYGRHGERRRPLILSRSGTSGSQRYGVAMWSGDIGANLASLATHYNAQMHMSLSGVDYFGSDIGGFHRGAIKGDSLDELYTQWLAAGAMLDVPVRVHTENLCNCKATAPNAVGHVPSNVANLRLRYSLLPYYYSLAHRARLHGEPLVAPPVHWFQDDSVVQGMGDHKLIGRDLLVALVAGHGAQARDVYLPAGGWVDFHTHERHAGGRWLRGVALRHDGRLRLPLYAREGALVPRMHVDARTTNSLGRRADGSARDELVVRAYPGPRPTTFTLYEDDGESVAYLDGEVATTVLAQRTSGGRTTVTVGARAGRYAGAPARRDAVVELAGARGRVTAVRLDGRALARHATRAAFDAAVSGWFDAGDGLVLARSGVMPVERARAFEFATGSR